MKHKLFIISGPSSVGKSHFLRGGHAAAITGIAADAPVYIPGEGIPKPLPNNRDCFLHYNINRPAHFIEYFQEKNAIMSRLKHMTWFYGGAFNLLMIAFFS